MSVQDDLAAIKNKIKTLDSQRAKAEAELEITSARLKETVGMLKDFGCDSVEDAKVLLESLQEIRDELLQQVKEKLG